MANFQMGQMGWAMMAPAPMMMMPAGGGGGGNRQKVDQPCRAFAANGTCSYGASCRFRHDGDTTKKGGNKDDSDDDGVVVAGKHRKGKSDKVGGKTVDPFNIRKKKSSRRTTLCVAKKDAKKLEYEGAPVPLYISSEIRDMLSRLDKNRGKIGNRKITEKGAKKWMDKILEQMDALEMKVGSGSDSSDSEDGKKDDDKFEKAMEMIGKGFQKQAETNASLLTMISTGKSKSSVPASPLKGKTRSPSGKLRKKRQSTGASSSASTAASSSGGGGSATAGLAARLFEQDSDDEEHEVATDEEEDQETIDKAEALGMMVGRVNEVFKKNDEIKWASSGVGPAGQIKFDENNPVRGDAAMKICGVNKDINACLKVQLAAVPSWQMQFELDDMHLGLEKIMDVMRVWKGYQRPGEVVNLLLVSHLVAIAGASNRKTHAVSLALILAREENGKPIPAVPAN